MTDPRTMTDGELADGLDALPLLSPMEKGWTLEDLEAGESLKDEAARRLREQDEDVNRVRKKIDELHDSLPKCKQCEGRGTEPSEWKITTPGTVPDASTT